ncbi:hypothetical protein FNW02_37300 [Komarekiella sp. 'clone 1']|uniref:Uncharacterized protein n=1 Tax=Komarekiella delphini-convector SJRDD-AB1 TaxID=2593771 RepID=A0AA41BAI2_9NOST|nr:hypothetical protein [Komarekiella delphini-convector]MBD6621205.1 hypothetical protein [Komarekiella delphini-convector SJRDD-AB1]
MTHQINSHQQLQLKSIARLKQIYSEIGCTAYVIDKRCKDAWMNAITRYQASILAKATPATSDEQTKAQAELDHHLATQAQAVAPEELRTVEISFYDHEYYCGDKLIAAITHDHNDFVTQRWVVVVNGAEIHRAATPMLCDRYIRIHYKDGSLPVQEQNATATTATTTGNEIMSQIFNECEKFGFEILDDGIYRNDEKLGEVGCSNGNWWFIRAEDETQQRISCDSALDAVWWLSMVDVSLSSESADEYLKYRPLEQMTGDELQRLLEKGELVAA